MNRISGHRRALLLSTAVAGVLLGGVQVRAQNIAINDTFGDGSLNTNTDGIGNGWTQTSNGYGTLATETGGAFHSDTSINPTFNYALQAISSKDGFDFWNSGGATLQFTTGNAHVSTNQDASLGQFPGGHTADWRQEIGMASGYRSNTDSADDELYLNTSGGLYFDLFYDNNTGPGGTPIVTGNVRAVNKNHPSNSDAEGTTGLVTIATFSFNGYDGQGDLLSTLHVNNTGFSLSFDKDVTWSNISGGGSVIGDNATDTLSGNYSDIFGAEFTDEFVNPYGPDAFVSVMGQNLDAGRGSGDLRQVVVDTTVPTKPPPAPDTFWAVSTDNWNVASNWSAGLPVPINNAVVDNNGTVTIDQPAAVARLLDIGSDRGLTAPIDATGRGGIVNVVPGADLQVGDNIRVGQAHNGTGTLNVTGGTITVHGAGIGDMYIGANGNGTMTMSGGTINLDNEFFLGRFAGSSGSLTISGGTITTNVLNSNIGNFLVAFGGEDTVNGLAGATATLDISGDAVINTNFLFSSFDPGTSSTITMTGGTINSHGAVVFGRVGQSTVNQSGGTINIPDGNGDFVAGDAGGCTYNISGTAAVNAANNFIVSTFPSAVPGQHGVVNMTGGSITASQYRIGAQDVGDFNQSAGTVHAQPGAIFNGSVFLGDFDHSHGNYTISGGTLQVDGNFNVGAALASNAAADNLRVEPTGPNDAEGQALDSNGTLTVSGSAATINIAGKFLADPADKSDFRGGPGDPDQTRANHANLNFEIFDDSGTSLVNVGGAGDLDGAVINVDLMNGYTPPAGHVFKLISAASFGDTGTGTTQHVGTGVGATQDPGDVGAISVGVLPDGVKESVEASAGNLPVNGIVGPLAAVIGGTVQVQPGSPVSNIRSLITNPGGRLDITNNKLVVGGSNTGTYNGTNYDGVTGMVASGRNGGAWNGTTGIISSTITGITDTLHNVGVASAADILALSGTNTGTWNGQTVDATDTLVMYTYGGDANLDGQINIDDYGRIDGNVGLSGTVFGWYNGDFNYDGKINIDDYGIIDGNIGIQGGPLTAFAQGGVTAVPEPASVSLIALGAMSLLGTRRRRRGA